MARREVRLHQILCVPETLPTRNQQQKEFLIPRDKNYICNSLLTPSLFRLILARLSLSQSFAKRLKRSICNISPELPCDRISRRVLKFAKFISERRHNNLQSQKFPNVVEEITARKEKQKTGQIYIFTTFRSHRDSIVK